MKDFNEFLEQCSLTNREKVNFYYKGMKEANENAPPEAKLVFREEDKDPITISLAFVSLMLREYHEWLHKPEKP